MTPDNHTAELADMQRRGMQNALAFGRATTGVFERLARQNYAVMGDVVDYTLAQLRIPTLHSDPRSALEAQAAGTRAAVEKARTRATEYAAIASELRDVVGDVARTATNTVDDAAASSPRSAPAASTPVAPNPPVAPKTARKPTADAAPTPAGGSPIIVPDDAPKAVARKTARAAAKPAGKTAGKAAAGAATKPAAKASAKKKPARGARGTKKG